MRTTSAPRSRAASRERDALLAARGVAEEAHGVERLARAAGGDEHAAAVEPRGGGVDRAVELRVRASAASRAAATMSAGSRHPARHRSPCR